MRRGASTLVAGGLLAAVLASEVGFGLSGGSDVGGRTERGSRSGAAHQVSVVVHQVGEADAFDRPDEPLFLIVAGTDERPGLSGARNDALHLVGVNPRLERATILNIPRDTYTGIPGHGRQKITAAHQLGGPPLLAETVAGLTGIRADLVLTTNFAGFVGLVNAVGGVRVEFPVAVRDPASSADFPPGRHLLSGEAALAYARARKNLPRGDFSRTHNQGRLLLAALEQFRGEESGYPATLERLATLLAHVEVQGLEARELFALARLALRIDPAGVANVTMPGTTGSAGGASVVFPTAGAAPLFADLADDGVVAG